MKVSDKMSTQLSTVSSDTKAAFAFLKMVQYGFRHLPVVELNGKLAGIVSYGDLREALQLKVSDQHLTIQHFEAGPLVQDVCSHRVTSITPDMDIKKAAKIMVHRKIGALPVVDNSGKLVGILTESDILSTFVEMLDTVNSNNSR